jgi:hypothetical protein
MIMSFSSEWHSIGREAELAAEQIASGVTALGRANHAQKGYYTQALFGLSIGLERLAKLIVIVDHALANSGQFPANSDLKRKGHNVAALLDQCEIISLKRRAGKNHSVRPNNIIHQGIVTTLTEFGELSRYYNLDIIVGGRAKQLPEPINAWWQRVGKPILSKHYTLRQQERDKSQSAAMAALMRGFTHVLHHSEEGELIDDIETLMARAGATRIVQTYGRLYTLQIVRWLTFLIDDLSHEGAYKKHIDWFMGLNEPFVMFMNEDNYLRGRKTWSIYKL